MKNQKNDRRSKYTKMIIKQALLELLTSKPLNKINITELCTIADINRSTFYNHFYDIFDVYENIENNFFLEIKQKLETSTDFNKKFIKEIMLFIYNNATLANLIVQNIENSDFLKKIISSVKDKLIKEWTKKFSQASLKVLEQIFSYNAFGSIGLITEWISDKMRQPIDEIADLIANVNKITLDHYLNKLTI